MTDMYMYRVLEAPDIVHEAHDSEEAAKSEAKRIVAETHHDCFIERFNGEEWQRGSIKYFWSFDHVCFWNHR